MTMSSPINQQQPVNIAGTHCFFLDVAYANQKPFMYQEFNQQSKGFLIDYPTFVNPLEINSSNIILETVSCKILI